MFKVPFRYGSAWTAADDANRARVAVISAELNDKLFGGADSVGRTLRLKDSDVRIIGVLGNWRPSPQFYDVRGGRFAKGDTAAFYGKPEDVFMPFSSGLEVNDGNFGSSPAGATAATPGICGIRRASGLQLWVQLDMPPRWRDYRQFLAELCAQQQKTAGSLRPCRRHAHAGA